MPAPTQTPTITTPATTPSEQPWQETHTDPERICPEQHRETASPDVMP